MVYLPVLSVHMWISSIYIEEIRGLSSGRITLTGKDLLYQRMADIPVHITLLIR